MTPARRSTAPVSFEDVWRNLADRAMGRKTTLKDANRPKEVSYDLDGKRVSITLSKKAMGKR